ncbi:hypothetical protein NOVA_27410 [Nocardia nova]|uniref:hypothetical protein n=1 Tax=Nocardia nova TaxID=37330 RepID=UPI001C495917|nr:hypothetical protein [Nocardia nova]MBV7706520.1 hypothetical protein [Nocardia nova]
MVYSQGRQRRRAGTMLAERPAPKQRVRVAVEEASPVLRVRYDSSWVRSSLSQLNFLRSARSMDAEVERVIDFAIRWAPFGGASSEDLLVAFGVGRPRFVEMMHSGLRSRRTDSKETRWLKGRLLEALALAWESDDAVVNFG